MQKMMGDPKHPGDPEYSIRVQRKQVEIVEIVESSLCRYPPEL